MNFEWIDINERRPNNEDYVLVTLREGAETPTGTTIDSEVELAWFVDDPMIDELWFPHFQFANTKDVLIRNEDVIAWAPLPAPYDEEAAGGKE